jgi:conjugal transfer pilus assembly protein TraF
MVNLVIKNSIICLMVIFNLTESFANEQFMGERGNGWHNYEDPVFDWKRDVEEDSKKSQSPVNPTEIVESFKKETAEKLNQAILNPTEENMLEYIKMENKALNNAAKFAEVKRVVALKNPEYDYSTINPTDQYVREVYYQKDAEAKSEAIASLKDSYGLFYFYMGSCGYCQKFAPVIKNFSDKYGWHVQAISLDGGASTEFPDFINDDGLYEKVVGRPDHLVPVLVAFDSRTQDLIPISFGAISESEMEENILLLVNYEKQKNLPQNNNMIGRTSYE